MESRVLLVEWILGPGIMKTYYFFFFQPSMSSGSPPVESLTTRLTLYFAFFMIGTFTWITTTALFAQASAFQLVLPEGSKIFTYIDTAMESGNVVPALIFVACSSDATLRAYNTRMTYAVALGSCLTAVLLAMLWHAQIGGASIVVLVGAWSSGAVGSTSMLVLFNFAGRFGRDAVSALSVGIGSCGLVTNVLGIVQGLPKLKDGNGGGGGTNASVTASGTSMDTPSSSSSSSANSLQRELMFGPTVYFFAVAVWIAAGCCCLRLVDSMSQWRKGEEEEKERRNEEMLARAGGGLKEEGANDVATTRQQLLSSNERGVNRVSGRTLIEAEAEETSNLMESNEDLHFSKKSVSFLATVWNKLSNAFHSIVTAVRQNSGSIAAIFVSCFLEFAAPGLIPYQVPKGPDHAANSFWVTVFYLSGSLIGRLLTAVVSFKKFTLLNILQGGTLVYMLVVARMTTVSMPVSVSIVIVAVGSAIHGYIVTEVFQTCREATDSARTSAVAGLANQVGALLGSVFVFVLVKMSLIGG